MMMVMGSIVVAGHLAADVTGTIFRDFDADGTRGTFEPGVGGVTINAFGGAGTPVGSSPQTTAFDGSYTLTGLPAGAVRIEVTLPTDGSLDFLDPGAAGRTTTTFAADGDVVDVGLSNPAQFCQASPDVALNCFVNGDLINGNGANNDALVTIPYDGYAISGDLNAPTDKVELALASEVGTAWGIAYQRRTKILFTSAAHKRHSSFGPMGPGGIYRVDATTGAVSPFLDINATGLFDAGTDVHTGLGDIGDPSTDPASFDAAGKTSLGDLAISEDDQTLWLVNVHERTLLEIPVGLPATAPAPADIIEHAIPTGQCTNGEFRPWAVEFHDGQVYVGGVCSGENGGSQADLFAFVYRHDPAGAPSSFTELYSFFIGYDRGCGMQFVPPFIGCDGFEPWKPDWFEDSSGNPGNPPDGPVQPPNPNLWAVPQPILTDIAFDGDGSLLLAFADRFNLQAGYENFDTVNGGPGAPTYSGVGAGETVRVCNVGGSFVLEGNPTCNGTGTNGDGPGSLGQEFYFADDAPVGSNIHQEGTLGAVAVLYGSGEVMATITDPVQVWSGGMAWFDADQGDTSTVFGDGAATPSGSVRRYEVFLGQFSPGQTGNGKNGGLGDMEILCDPAPIEIGNRVWCDAPGVADIANGIQDPPGAAGVPDVALPGVVVQLSCNGGAITASDTTSTDGSYLFDDSNVAGGIPPSATCTLSIDTAANAAALGTCNNATLPDVGVPTDPGQDIRDSDGTDADGNGVIEATVVVGGPGANDHAIDFGFRGLQPIITAVKADALLVDGDIDGMLDGGDSLRYTVVITNSGNADATGVTYASGVDANTTLVVGSVTTSQGTVTTGNTGGDISAAVNIGTLSQAGGTVTITYDVVLNNPVPVGVTAIACQGTVTAGNHGDVPTDDPDDPTTDDSTDTPVDASPDVSATKVDAILVDGDMDGRADAGDTLKYTVVVTNSGDQDGTAVVYASSVGANTTLVVGSVMTSQGTVTTGNGGGDTAIAIDIGTLAGAGGTVTIMYEVLVDTPIPAGVTQVSCQGTVTGGNVPSTPTDDPDDPTTDDPTDTPLDLGSDFGDAPDSYTTTASPSHALDAAVGLYLGACIDAESAGQPAIAGDPADGDDLNDLGAPGAVLGACAGNDDEDGVTFDTMIVACATDNGVTVTSSVAGLVDAWIDFDGDGAFTGSGEQVFTSQVVAAGANALTFVAPCSAESGTTYARFRVSTAGGLSFDGAAVDGEVEDYQVTTKGLDLGDAPDTYGTMDPATAASHVVDPNNPLYLGGCVDTESAGQPNADANGDDTNTGASTVGTCTGNDDEDGVTFDTMIVACATDNEVTVTSVGTGAVLDAWIDFDGDGSFTGAGEQIFASQALTGGDTLTFATPCTAGSSVTYARFRTSTAGGLASDGPAMDGEVEDYRVTVKGLDFGDAPDTFTTTASPSHVVDPGTPLYLGACVDTEVAGQPSLGADGDDLDVGVSTVGTCAGSSDEDGVTFDTAIIACGAADVTVTASQAGGLLDAWLDFDGNGTFEAADQIFANQALAAGANTLTFAVPCDRPSDADSYARFRVSTAGGLSFDGEAMDGEVEDYVVATNGLDFGDAPETYGTTDPTTGASHVVDPGAPLYLGACVDTEAAGQPVTGGMPATGDDTGAGISDLGGCTGPDDEDGVTFDSMIVACGTANVTVTSSLMGLLDGWIDFDGDGSFGGAEQVFASQLVTPGANALELDVPCATPTQAVTYARFRLSSSGGLGPIGQATNGEVEDYDVTTKGLDFGDAPDTYATTVGTGGARHAVDPSTPLFLGGCVDTEVEGQPVSPGDPANGDDNGIGISDLGGCAGPDDEDGVTFDTMIVACGDADITVTASQAGLLDAWVDFDGDGAFAGAEQVFTSQPVASGGNSLTFAVPCATPTQVVTYARFRVSSVGGLGFGGPAMNGEVEDYAITTKGLDFGDAPSPYPTTLADNGARHVVQPTGNPTLGTPADTEPDGQPDGAHAGDDQNGTPDDEDGVTFSGLFVPGGTAVNVTVTAGATGGLVDLWFDWNRDGDWSDPGEQVATSLPLGAGASTVLSIAAPAGSVEGASCARARISSAGGLAPDGPAMDGEIEDYPVAVGVEDPAIGVAKELVGIAFVGDGEYAVDLLLTVSNAGNVMLSNAQVESFLASAFADAESFTVSLVSSPDFAVNPAFDGDSEPNMLLGTDQIGIGDLGVLALQVVVRPGFNPGPYFCGSKARAESPGGEVVEDDSQSGSDADPDGNGDPTDDNEPTEVVLPLSPTDIPTLGEWSLMLLSMLLALVGLRAVRRI